VHTYRNAQVYSSPVAVRTVQRASSVDQAALTARWPYRIFLSMPYSPAVSRMYWRIAGPSAIVRGCRHGRNG
jgi:hypothetical protein